MDSQKALDYAIKRYEMARDPKLRAGYRINGNKTYDTYLENTFWDGFKTTMEQSYYEVFTMFNAGGGKELEERKVGANIYPPKMASFGSSSRMIFNLSKDIPGFQFELKLPTTVGGIANLDGFLEKEHACVFVEAKCREPYAAKDNIIEMKYKDLYQFLTESNGTSLMCEIDDKSENKMKVVFLSGETQMCYFDIKQMISHLLGIGTALLNCRYESKSVEFLYLLYNPTKLCFDSDKTKEKIHFIYEKVCAEANSIDFQKLFYEVLVYLQTRKEIGTEKNLDELIKGFSFVLCDQETYFNHFK